MSTTTLVTLEQLQVLEQKAKTAVVELKKSFEAAIGHIESIEKDFIENKHINERERPLYLNCDSELGYLFHDWSNLDAGWQNEEILRWLKDIKAYKNALEQYREQYNKTH